jgi:hypothetical protein
LLACRWQASPSLEGWPPPAKCNEAESGSLTLGLAPSSSSEFSSPSPPTLWAGNRPAARGRLPCTGGRNYMLNEQLTCPTPCSRIDQPGFVLAHQIATDSKMAELSESQRLNFNPCNPCLSVSQLKKGIRNQL